jgi:cobalt/nickel transport system permease protein
LDWLFKEDNYVLQEDKDAFLDKSIFSGLKLLSKIKRGSFVKSDGVIYKINPALKLIATLIILILLSVSRSGIFLLSISFFVLIEVIMLEVEDIKKVVSLIFFVFLFAFIVLMPSIFLGNIKNSVIILFKVSNSVALINILSCSTRWHDITKVLKILFVPDIFILDLTIRYIFLLGSISLDMLYALKLRSIGRNDKKYTSINSIIGSLFLRSKETGDEVYASMECRGFTGEYSAKLNFKFTNKDGLYILLNLLLVIAFIVSGR